MELDFAVITPLIRAVSMAVSTLQRRGVTLILVLGAQLAYFNLKWAGPVKPLHQVFPPPAGLSGPAGGAQCCAKK